MQLKVAAVNLGNARARGSLSATAHNVAPTALGARSADVLSSKFMHMLFVDESGTPPAPGVSNPQVFVLGGVIVPDAMWDFLATALCRTKQAYRVEGEIKWRHFSPANKSKDNSLLHLTMAQRNAMRDTLFNHLVSVRSFKILAVVTNAQRAYQKSAVNNADDLYHFTYKPMTERFQYFLQDLERESGSKANGIIVADHRGPKDDARLRELHLTLLNGGGEHVSRYSNLVEGLFIAPSDSSVGIQYADLVAGAVYRAFAHSDTTYFDKLRSAFRCHPRTGSIDGYGLVHQPKK